MRLLIVIVGAVALVSIVFVASRPDATGGAVHASPSATARPFVTADPAVTSRTDPDALRARLPADDRADRRRIVVRGLALPIADVPLPTDPELLPNAARVYRGGWHEGIDFPASAGTPVRAVAAGAILRIDHDYVAWSPEAEAAALDEAVRLGYTPAATLDRIRGRQVWIDHGNGIVSRYAHLSAVAGLSVGDPVSAGDVIGAVGSSGYPEGGPHLHLEIRVGTSYLGDGLADDALRAAIAAAFDDAADGPRSR